MGSGLWQANGGKRLGLRPPFHSPAAIRLPMCFAGISAPTSNHAVWRPRPLFSCYLTIRWPDIEPCQLCQIIPVLCRSKHSIRPPAIVSNPNCKGRRPGTCLRNFATARTLPANATRLSDSWWPDHCEVALALASQSDHGWSKNHC